jgi:uncharacterized tellurite resistance protein B-like protein
VTAAKPQSWAISESEAMTPEQLERQQMAFLLKVALRIVAADNEVKTAELTAMDKLFPARELQRVGFVNENFEWVFSVIDKCFKEAKKSLPTALSHPERLAMIRKLADLSLADYSLTMREIRIVEDAAELMGINRNDLMALLDQVNE